MQCSPLRCPYSNSEQPPRLCGAAGPEGSQQHGCSGTVTTRGPGRQPRGHLAVCPCPALCSGPARAPAGPRSPHTGSVHTAHTGQAGPGAAAPGRPAASRARMGAERSPPSPRARRSAPLHRPQRPSRTGERGRQRPLSCPGPGRANRRPSLGAVQGGGAPIPRPAPSRRR